MLSVVNNLATAVQQAFNLFEVSKIHEEAFSEIQATFWSFATLSGRFLNKTHETAFAEFADKVVRVKRHESEQVRAARTKGRQAAGNDKDDNAPADEFATPRLRRAKSQKSQAGTMT